MSHSRICAKLFQAETNLLFFVFHRVGMPAGMSDNLLYGNELAASHRGELERYWGGKLGGELVVLEIYDNATC